jgi:hypothetical protein
MNALAMSKTCEGKKGSREHQSPTGYDNGSKRRRTVTVVVEDLAHNLLYIFIRDLCGLLVEEISLLLVKDIEVSSEIVTEVGRGLREFVIRDTTGMRVGLKGSDGNGKGSHYSRVPHASR